MTVHIADTNVLVKYVVPEEFSSVARRIIGQYEDAQLRLIAPDYIFIECATTCPSLMPYRRCVNCNG